MPTNQYGTCTAWSETTDAATSSSELGRPADGDQEDHGGQRNRHDAQRPAGTRLQPLGFVGESQSRIEVLGPAIVVVDHPRPDVHFAADHVVETVNVAGRVRVGVELIGRQQAVAGDRSVI